MNWCLARTTVTALIVVLCASFGQPSAAKDQLEIRRANIPLFFATDRMPKNGNVGKFDYGNQNTEQLDSLTYGLVNKEASISAVGEGDFDALTRIGWTKTGTAASPESTEHKPAPNAVAGRYENHKYESWQQFEDALKAAVGDADRKELVIFVHGCCVSFNKSCQQAASLAAATRGPVVFYDWGSPGGNYVGSLIAYPRSQERFNQFILRLLKAFPTERISIVGLSMGNVLIYNFCLQNRTEDLPRAIDDLELARADIDSIAFRTNMSRVLAHCKRVHLYVARNDFSINLSGFIRGLVYPHPLVFMVGHPHDKREFGEQIQVYDVSRLKLGHVLPSKVIAEVLRSNGMPTESTHYAYEKDGAGAIAVKQHETLRN